MPKSDQGVSSDRYQLIPRTLIFVKQGERVLLLKGAPTKRLWPNRYNGIGGHIERGEDALSSARRELFEEAGLQGGRMWLCGTIFVDASDRVGIGIFVFRCDFDSGEQVTPKPSDEGTLEWIPFDQYDRYPLVEDLKRLLRLIMEKPYGSPPFSARSYYDENDELQLDFVSVS